jgi:hypothetical protein
MAHYCTMAMGRCDRFFGGTVEPSADSSSRSTMSSAHQVADPAFHLWSDVHPDVGRTGHGGLVGDDEEAVLGEATARRDQRVHLGHDLRLVRAWGQ